MNGTDSASTIAAANSKANTFLENLEDARFLAGHKNRMDDKFNRLYDIAARKVAIHNKQVDIMRDIAECDKLEGVAMSAIFDDAFDQYCKYLTQAKAAIAAVPEYLQ